MTTVEDFHLRLSATKDVLVGLQQSGLPLVRLEEEELRARARSLVDFLARVDPNGADHPHWLSDVAHSAEDYLVDCLGDAMDAGLSRTIASSPPMGPAGHQTPTAWWRFWGR
jgi:hypothetical protein